jgi:NADH-quinone oxidoreductase subunit L
MEHTVVYFSVAIALVGLAGAWYFFGNLARAEAMRARFRAVYDVLAAKYYVDELYDALLGRPLTWISKHVFLDFGDRAVLDGTLDGLARVARRTAGVLARVQTGQLQLYLTLALAGLVAALWWATHV